MAEKKKKNPLGLMAGMDKDIESVKHDEIMVWLDKNLYSIIGKIYPNLTGKRWSKRDILRYEYESNEDFDAICQKIETLLETLPQKKPFTIYKKTWEWPINKDKEIISRRESYKDIKIEPEIRHLGIVFEVKTSISLGQLIRQVNFYKQNFKFSDGTAYVLDPDFVVVSPDRRYEEILDEQGIFFLEYEPDAKWKQPILGNINPID
jgi:hypothetical protein